MPNKKDIVGIVGGMGPMAGVHLQKKIIELTPAKNDQDHLEVICYTNPKIRDRSTSLRIDGGTSYTTDIIDSIHMLERMGATKIVIACNTAYAQRELFARATTVEFIDIPKEVICSILKSNNRSAPIALLGTTGLYENSVYEVCPGYDKVRWITLTEDERATVMDAIYKIKSGGIAIPLQNLKRVIKALSSRGAEIVILGCTDLSPHSKELARLTGVVMLDPLEVVANLLTS